MFLTAPELAGSCDWWFCLKAKPKREHVAAAYLRHGSGIEVFCPRVRFRKPTARGPVWFIEPLFPGYLFARFEFEVSHRLVRQVRGISGFVQFGDRFGLLPDLLIEELKRRVGENELVEIASTFVPGQNVQFSQGPFQGLEALVNSLHRRQRPRRGFDRMDGTQSARGSRCGRLAKPSRAGTGANLASH